VEGSTYIEGWKIDGRRRWEDLTTLKKVRLMGVEWRVNWEGGCE